MKHAVIFTVILGLAIAGSAASATILANKPVTVDQAVLDRAADEPYSFDVDGTETTADHMLDPGVYLGGDLLEIATDAGDIVGTAVDAETGDILQGVEIDLYLADGTPVDVTASDSLGKFSFPAVTDDDYVMTLNFAGYKETVIWGTVVTDEVTQLPPGLMIREPVILHGNVSGRVLNALTGMGMGNVQLELREGINAPNTEPVVYTATTGAAGYYGVQNMIAGVYTATVTNATLCSSSFSIWVQGSDTINQPDATVTQDLVQGQLRIVLSWGAIPTDLDSHLWAPHNGCSTQNPFHLYYGNRSSQPCGALINLDLDDVTSYGPETTTIGVSQQPVVGQPYNFLVHDYSNLGSYTSQAMSNSQGLQVQVFGSGGAGECTNTVYTMPPGTPATVWHVFTATFDGSSWSITPADEYCFQSNPTLVGPTC